MQYLLGEVTFYTLNEINQIKNKIMYLDAWPIIIQVNNEVDNNFI